MTLSTLSLIILLACPRADRETAWGVNKAGTTAGVIVTCKNGPLLEFKLFLLERR